MISYTGELWPTLGWMLLSLSALALIVGIVVWRGRRKGSRTVALNAALTISGWWLALTAIGMALIVVKVFSTDFAEFSGQTHVWLPWPADLPCTGYGESAGTALSCSGSNLADFTVAQASFGLRTLAGAAQLVSILFTAVPATMLAVISWHTLRGRAFTRVITRTLFWGAVAILILGIASDLLSGIAATTALREVFPPDSEWYPWGFQITITWWPMLASLGLAALAAVFRQGIRVQQENDQLQRETEGLV